MRSSTVVKACVALAVVNLAVVPLAAPGAGASSSALFAEPFDGGPLVGWMVGGLWHVSTCRSVSAPASLAYNKPGCPSNFDTGARNSGSAVTPPIPLPVDSTPVLSWSSWHDTEDGNPFDQKRVAGSVDGGLTWTELWFEDGAQKTWNARAVPLGQFAGQAVQLRFSFDSVDSIQNHGEGWYVDDVAVDLVPSPVQPPLHLRAQPGFGEVLLSWDPPLDTGGQPLVQYQVFRGDDPARVTEFVASVPAWKQTYTHDVGLEGLVRNHFYKVRAFTEEHASPPSAPACSPTRPFAFSVLGPACPAPEGWDETVLLDETLVVPGAGAGTEPVDLDLVEVNGAPDGDFYLLEVRVAGQALPTLALFTGGALVETVEASLLQVPAQSAQAPGAEARVQVLLRHDPTVPTVCAASVGGGCLAEAPAPAYLAGDAARSELVVQATLQPHGELPLYAAVRVPFGGQAGAVPP